MPPKGMTANPVKPARYRPGKAVAEQASSSEESGADSEQEQEQQAPAPRQPPPKATSFPSDAKKITSNLKNVDLNERRRQAEAKERARRERERAEVAIKEREAGFVTESESGSEDSGDQDDRIALKPAPSTQARRSSASTSTSASSDDDEDTTSSSSASPAPKLIRPVFLRKDQRGPRGAALAAETEAAAAAAETARRAAARDALVQEHLAQEAALRAAGRRGWDDDAAADADEVDDTDGVEPELERAEWVARELARVKRGRAALEAREAEIAEVERRRGLSAREREEEDREVLGRQAAEREGRGKAGFMARYHHKGAFYREEGEETGLADRDLMGATYEGREGMGEALPEFLQVRDATMVGRKGRTRYKDLKSEDTGRWGEFGRGGWDGRGGGGKDGRGGGAMPFINDERFQPDRFGAGGPGAGGPGGGTGANASGVGERRQDRDRKRMYDDAGREDAKRPRYAA